ncbi:MAG TPA: DUF2637 domain-containing protein [Pseudonocardiaceae bacterium]|jgi:hypothetical protein|nr:DUF2637 domain-containing protein [Pseudonocardiaceae bacterium]
MTKGIRLTGMISVALVALVAAIVSYTHMQVVAEHAGQGWRSWLEPLSVDGLLVGASLVLYVRRNNLRAWIAVIAGILVSLVANLAAAEPTLTSRLVSAWPAIALALSYETLLTLVRQRPASPAPSTTESVVTEPVVAEPVALEPVIEPVIDSVLITDPEPEEQPAMVNGFTFGDPNAWARISSGAQQ